MLTKVSCHLAAAYRLRQRLASNEARAGLAEAVLGHDGRVHHAEGEARSKTALSRLKHSALAIGRSRGTLRVRDPEQAVDEWKGLTDREQEVVAFASMGHHNKLIAYNLGISHSTVRVLIARAAAKLGARSRDELVRRRQEVLAASSRG